MMQQLSPLPPPVRQSFVNRSPSSANTSPSPNSVRNSLMNEVARLRVEVATLRDALRMRDQTTRQLQFDNEMLQRRLHAALSSPGFSPPTRAMDTTQPTPTPTPSNRTPAMAVPGTALFPAPAFASTAGPPAIPSSARAPLPPSSLHQLASAVPPSTQPPRTVSRALDFSPALVSTPSDDEASMLLSAAAPRTEDAGQSSVQVSDRLEAGQASSEGQRTRRVTPPVSPEPTLGSAVTPMPVTATPGAPRAAPSVELLEEVAALRAEVMMATSVSPITATPMQASDSKVADEPEAEEKDDEADDDDDEEEEEEDPMAASEALARQLMEQESAMMFQQLQQAQVRMALQMQGDGDGVDEDLAFAAQLMRDEVAARVGDLSDLAQTAAMDGDESEGEVVDPDGMSYDQLLDLGSRIGDVAKDRWKLRAQSYISRLPLFQHRVDGEPLSAASSAGAGAGAGAGADAEDAVDPSTLPPSTEANGLGDSADRCLVCQCEYEHEEVLTVLPCRHLYHSECVNTWLSSNKTCPLCKADLMEAMDKDTEAEAAEAEASA